MCGLTGFIGAGDRDDLLAMTNAVSHRGPDGEGYYIDGDMPVYLGHRRLSIVDLADGEQPMQDATGQTIVVYNGEIYNHLELRRQLEAKGHRFRTDHSDTEVLLHGWREWGPELPARLNGMFAFALFDRRRRMIFLARDRFGEKPIHWARSGQTVLFASELSALARHRSFRPCVNRRSLKKLFAYGFIPSPSSFWCDAEKLPPGASLLIPVDEPRSATPAPYYQFKVEPDESITLDKAATTVRDLLVQSVDRRLMGDVPLGVFLSGGVDSSAVAACAAKLRGGASVNTFSIGFQEASFDESPYARQMAAQLGTCHNEQILTMLDGEALIPEVLGRLDEPMGDPSILPTYMLCRFAARRVKVALSGDGGDELFAGYDTFAALKTAALYQRFMPSAGHAALRRLVDLLPKSAANMSLDFKLRRALNGMSVPPELWHPAWLAPLQPAEIADLFQEKTDAEDLYSEALDIWRGSASTSMVDKALEFYTRLYLPDDILTKVDRVAMMNGLEARSVFLDNDLVDYVRQLPASLKYDRGARKIVLKKSLAGLVPDSILRRRKKGFGIPLLEWLKRRPFPGPIQAVHLDDSLARRWYGEHLAGKTDHRMFLWDWTVLANYAQGRV